MGTIVAKILRQAVGPPTKWRPGSMDVESKKILHVIYAYCRVDSFSLQNLSEYLHV